MSLDTPIGLYHLMVQAHSSSNTHLVAVTGMSDDGTPGGLRIRFNDPDGGRRRALSFEEFTRENEGAADRPGLDAMIMHY
jgi:hypothetical protein